MNKDKQRKDANPLDEAKYADSGDKQGTAQSQKSQKSAQSNQSGSMK